MIVKPAISKKLSIFPTPRYLRIKNIVSASAVKNPRLVFAKSVEKVNKSAKKIVIKKAGMAPKVSGSTK